ncbi:MAG: hypothetical protein EHM21_09405 [Chloroflexi bacterium]|nr:MAG: hypothetical protein EHM21_09405 [Chloroflexota bacterium]
MNRRERLMNTLAGRPVDRPAVCFYEINGLDETADRADPADRGDPADWQDPVDVPDSFNIYSHPSWAPLIDLAREKSDRIVMRPVRFPDAPDPVEESKKVEVWYAENGSRYERRAIQCGKRTLTSVTRRDPDINTIWQVEHLFKDAEDVRVFLELPSSGPPGKPDIQGVLETERELGDSGLVMIDTPDALCQAASLFHLADFTILALTDPALFHRLLDRFAADLQPRTEAVARALPGRLWRIYGPEYASPPYLHPRQFHEFVVNYDLPMVKAIQQHGGYARIHSHGRLRLILDGIISTGCDGLDPIEPPPQGDMRLAEVRERCGQQMVLFGNLEASDIENLPADEFREKVRCALEEGVGGRGFVLMPSSCPYGRVLTERALKNYEVMIEEVNIVGG